MSSLTGWEQALERVGGRLWERWFPKEPVELVAALRQECDRQAVVCGENRVVVPNAYDVELAEHVHAELGGQGARVGQVLTDKLAQYGARRGYEWAGPLAVHVTTSRDVPNDRYRVTSKAMAHVSAVGFPSVSG